MNSKNMFSIGALLLVFAAIVYGGLQAFTSKKPPKILPVLGEFQEIDSLGIDGKHYMVNKPHTIPPFSFINQYGQTVTHQDLNSKIYVTDFFFTTCQSICPVMSVSMQRMQEVFKNQPDVSFLSHTVDPETDSVPQLLAYANRHNAIAGKWHFLTGNKKDLYHAARSGYLVTATEGDGGEEDFIHTQNFVLIDKMKRIRGYYDGTDSLEVNKMINDVNLLLAEYAYQNP
jgi:protein SCO1/2